MKNSRILTLLTLCSASAAADTIALYDFSNTIDNEASGRTFEAASVDTESATTAGIISSPSVHNQTVENPGGVVNPEFGDPFNYAGNPRIGWSARGGNPAQNFSIILPVDTFFTFDITVDALGTMDLTTVSLVTGVFTTLGNLTAYDYTLSYSLDNSSFTDVATVISGANPGEAATTAANGTVTAPISFDLSGITELQGLVDATVYFRLDPVASAGANQNGVQNQRAGFIDDVTLEGTVSPARDPIFIPESTSLNGTSDGSPLEITIPIANDGSSQDLVLDDYLLGGPDGEFFEVTSDPSPIAAGSSGNLVVTLTPEGAGFYDADLTFSTNDSVVPSITYTLLVEVQDPVIEVDQTLLNFGNNGAGILEFTISNLGGGSDLTVDLLDISGDDAGSFAIVSPSLPASIPAGADQVVQVSFTPGSHAGRYTAAITVDSDDYFNTLPIVDLTAFVTPSGIIVASYDFDPSVAVADQPLVDSDDSGSTEWTTSDLSDQATGLGAISAGNQTTSNRIMRTGADGNYLAFSTRREDNDQTPVAAGSVTDEMTWTTFTVSPQPGGGSIDFTGGFLLLDSYAFSGLTGTTSGDWTAYYSTDNGVSFTSLGTMAGASISGIGATPPKGLTWDLSGLGTVTGPVIFAVDPFATADQNGSVAQRAVGFDNLHVVATATTPGSGGFASWASTNGVSGEAEDLDFDGIPALLEYALGLNPNAADPFPGTFEDNVLSFTKGAEAVANGDVTYTIETSGDLGQTDPWTARTADSNDASAITFTLPSGQEKNFARLTVTLN